MLDHQVRRCLKFIKYRSYIHNLFTGYIAGFLNHQQFDWDFQELTKRWWLTLEDMFHQPPWPIYPSANMENVYMHMPLSTLTATCITFLQIQVMVRNIPPMYRSDSALKEYFDRVSWHREMSQHWLFVMWCVWLCVCVSRIWPGPQKPQFHTERNTWKFWDTLALRFLFKRITFWEMRARIKEYHCFRWSWLH